MFKEIKGGTGSLLQELDIFWEKEHAYLKKAACRHLNNERNFLK